MSDLDDRFPPIIYLDAQLGTASATPTPIYKVVTRNTNILADASKYAVAIVRLTLPLTSVFNWQPELLIGQATAPPIQTIYRCQMSFNGTSGPITYMDLIRSRYDQAEPPVPLQAQPTNEWASVNSQATVVNMLNNWLFQAFNGLKAALGGSFPGVATQPQAPYYTFDSTTGIMTVNGFPSSVYDVTNLAAPNLEIWFGAEFKPYLDGFNTRVYSVAPTITGKDVQLVLSQTAGQFLDSVGTAPTTWLGPPGDVAAVAQPRDDATALLQCPQDYATPWVFDRALSTVQITSSLPTLLEASDPPVVLLGQITDGTQSMLMDFALDLSSNLSASSGPILYTAASVIPGARFTSLIANGPVRSFTIGAQWVDSYGIVRPLLVSSGQSASIKLAFVRKDLLNGSISL